MPKYKNLIVWQKANDLALKVYKLTETFPKKETFGITSQIRRAALSVPTNIVEGYSRRTKNELSRFIDIARGSLAETEYLLEFSMQRNKPEEQQSSSKNCCSAALIFDRQ